MEVGMEAAKQVWGLVWLRRIPQLKGYPWSSDKRDQRREGIVL